MPRTRGGAPTATPTPEPAGRPRRWPAVGWVLAAAGVLAVLLAVVFVLPRLLYPPLPASRFAGVAPDKRIELETNRLKLQNDARATLLQALAGGVLLLGASLTWRQLGVTREGQITDRYTKGVDQLGSQHLDVRLGGIYALERIARDSPHDRVTIEEVLTAFVRGHAPWPPPPAPPSLQAITLRLVTFAQRQRSALQRRTAKDTAGQNQPGGPDEQGAEAQGPAADVQAAVTVLGRRELPPDGLRRLDLSQVDLRGASLLLDANLRGAWLNDVNLQGAVLWAADLQGAQLFKANLQDAGLVHANLRGAWLDGANLHRALLNSADLRGAKLFDANLQGALAGEATRWLDGWDRARAEARGVTKPPNASAVSLYTQGGTGCATAAVGLSIPAVSTARRSVIDPQFGEE
jgi:hypothetical protein